MKNTLAFLLLYLMANLLPAQDFQSKIQDLEKDYAALAQQQDQIQQQIEAIKLEQIRSELNQFGIPAIREGEQLIEHAAMSLVYDEQHEQAKWVAHVITPDIITGKLPRTNDFRPDPKIVTGSTVEADYFLKAEVNGKMEYDGYGFDRGHLAPSADFRWSRQAVSESYLYSNMAPQRPEFNREKWAELEDFLRAYVYRNSTPKAFGARLYVCTGGLLQDDLPKSERSVNGVSIPEYFWKVVIDPKNNKGIGFLMPNQQLTNPLSYYTFSIDSIELLTGLDFFQGLGDDQESQVESQNNFTDWSNGENAGNVPPIPFSSLPKKTYNTTMAKKLIRSKEKVTVAGHVVSGRRSRKGNVILNLDNKYPNTVFNVFIRKEDLVNFSYDPVESLKGKLIYVSGQVGKLGDTPTMYIKNDQVIATP